MNIKITKSDRIHITTSLPQRGSFEDLLAVKDILKKLELTEVEKKDINLIITPQGEIKWNDPENIENEYELSSSEINYIKKIFDEKDTKKELTFSQIEIVSKIKDWKIE